VPTVPSAILAGVACVRVGDVVAAAAASCAAGGRAVASDGGSAMSRSEYADLVLMVDVFCACIETGCVPSHGSRCHRLARRLVDASGIKPKRKRRRLPPNARLDRQEEAR